MSRDAVTDGQPRSGLERRVVAAAETLLTRSKSVSPVDVLAAIGWLPASLVDQWRRGRVECLERVAPVHPDKLASALEHLRRWAADKGLEPSEVAYVAATRDRRALRFTADGDQVSERAWRTHWIAADLSEAARERVAQRQSRAPDLVVVEPLSEWTCTGCGGSGSLLFMEDDGPLCLGCADLDHLVFLPAGGAEPACQAGKPPVGGGGPLQPLAQAVRAPRDPGGGGCPRAGRGAVPGRRGRARSPPRTRPAAARRPGPDVPGSAGRGGRALVPGLSGRACRGDRLPCQRARQRSGWALGRRTGAGRASGHPGRGGLRTPPRHRL